MEALPWILSTAAVLGVLLMVLLDGCKRRAAGAPQRGSGASRVAKAAKTRAAVRKASRGRLGRIKAALESDSPEEGLADEANRTESQRK